MQILLGTNERVSDFLYIACKFDFVTQSMQDTQNEK